MKKNKGFTLFELLVSISIIGILTALASVAFSGAQKKARDARRMQDVKLVQTAAEQYYSQNNYQYPLNSEDAIPWMGGTQEILSVFPTDPKDSLEDGYIYNYNRLTPDTFCMCALMENTSNSNASDDNCTLVAPGTGDHFCAKNQQ